MANIIGEPLKAYVANQINARQKLHGSGVFKTIPNSSTNDNSSLYSLFENYSRNEDQISTLNSNTAWIKLASGVSLTGSEGSQRLKDIGFLDEEISQLLGDSLAKNFILYGGTATWGTNGYGNITTTQRQGFLENFDPNSSYMYSSTPVTVKNPTTGKNEQVKAADFGYSPMPGIVSAEIKSLNRGSLEKAFIKIKANDRRQLDILDLLYMRLGYTVLLEWGHSLYTTDGENKKRVNKTLIEDKFFQVGEASSYFDFMGVGGLSLIESYRNEYAGNYDGMLAVVSNFSWTFNPDGSYDIDLTLISMGDVIESLKSNVSIDSTLASAINTVTTSSESNDPVLEQSRSTNIISSALYIYKLLGYTYPVKPVSITTADAQKYEIGRILNPPSGVTILQETFEFYYRAPNPYDGVSLAVSIGTRQTFTSLDPDNEARLYIQTLPEYIEKTKSSETVGQAIGGISVIDSDGKSHWFGFTKLSSNVSNTIPNPLDTSIIGDAIVINTDTTKCYYLRFGYLLQFLQEKVIPVIKGTSNPPLTKIDYDVSTNKMYFISNQISLDPRICLVRNDSFLKSNGNFAPSFTALNPFTDKDSSGTRTKNSNVAYPMNIYLNFEFIISSLNNNTNEKGDVSIYGLISSICSGINKTLGGINNLEPVIDKNTNVLKIIDSTPIPGVSCPDASTPYDLNLFGYYQIDKSKRTNAEIAEYTSTFVRKVDLKTAITPEYATMVTIGATAGGYVKGTEATAFSRWNLGLKDRFKNEIVVPNPPSSTTTSGLDEAEYNYATQFLRKKFQCYGFNDPPTIAGSVLSPGIGTPSIRVNNLLGDVNPEVIEKNLSVVTEFYKYLIAKKGQKSQQAGTIGFIPFKLGINMDGISGIKIYNKLEVNSKFLPTKYGDTLNFIITGVNHSLKDNDWETNLETIVMPKTSTIDSLDLNLATIKEIIKKLEASEALICTPEASAGTLGTNPSAALRNPNALSLSKISAIEQKAKQSLEDAELYWRPKNEAIADQIKASTPLRLAIVRAAASYVGQTESNKGDNLQFCDPVFETAMKDIGWSSGLMWCSLFAKRVWKDAYYSGNNVISSGIPDATTKEIWTTTLKNGALIASSGQQIMNNFANVQINSKSTRKAITLNEAITGAKPLLPGDMFRADIGHTGIVVSAAYGPGGKVTNIGGIDGNCLNKVCYQPSMGFASIGVNYKYTSYDFAQVIF